MTNKERYMKEINTISEYKITWSEFFKWCYINKITTDEILEFYDGTEESLYDVANDYTIPIIMVKKIIKEA